MKNSTFFLLWGFGFISLGLIFPYYVYTDWGMIPLGMSFLVDAPVFFIVSMGCWMHDSLVRAKREDFSETYEEVRRLEL